jgi:hypothetical protein
MILDRDTIYRILGIVQERSGEFISCYHPVYNVNVRVIAFECNKCDKRVIDFWEDYQSIKEIVELMWNHYKIHLPYQPPMVGVR